MSDTEVDQAVDRVINMMIETQFQQTINGMRPTQTPANQQLYDSIRQHVSAGMDRNATPDNEIAAAFQREVGSRPAGMPDATWNQMINNFINNHTRRLYQQQGGRFNRSYGGGGPGGPGGPGGNLNRMLSELATPPAAANAGGDPAPRPPPQLGQIGTWPTWAQNIAVVVAPGALVGDAVGARLGAEFNSYITGLDAAQQEGLRNLAAQGPQAVTNRIDLERNVAVQVIHQPTNDLRRFINLNGPNVRHLVQGTNSPASARRLWENASPEEQRQFLLLMQRYFSGEVVGGMALGSGGREHPNVTAEQSSSFYNGPIVHGFPRPPAAPR